MVAVGRSRSRRRDVGALVRNGREGPSSKGKGRPELLVGVVEEVRWVDGRLWRVVARQGHGRTGQSSGRWHLCRRRRGRW